MLLLIRIPFTALTAPGAKLAGSIVKKVLDNATGAPASMITVRIWPAVRPAGPGKTMPSQSVGAVPDYVNKSHRKTL